MKHTAGPWELDWKNSCISADDGDEVIVYDEDATLPNLTLMAAAPDLLNASKAALVALKLYKHINWQEAVDYLELTIRKAEGKDAKEE